MNINYNQTAPTADIDSRLEELYSSISGRPAFSYNPGSDPLYRSYADEYSRRGKMAMRDTMGQAAHLTGGYGSSYSHTAGQQQYDEYLHSLSEVLPELYDMSLAAYKAEGDNLKDMYDMNWQLREDEYQRGRDETEDAREQNKLSYQHQQDAYEALYQIISSSGYNPTDAELRAAGMTRDQANALIAHYKRKNKLNKVTYSSGGSSGSSTERKLVENPVSKASKKSSTGASDA